MGLDQEAFLHSILPSFRFTIYATKNSVNIKGRLKLEESIFSYTVDNDVKYMKKADDIVVLDRLGSSRLSDVFSTCAEKAIHSMSTSFAFSHYSNPSINLSYIALPTISASLSVLSSMPTIRQLELINKDLHMKHNKDYDEIYGRLLLLDILIFFERINVISFWVPGGSLNGKFHIQNAYVIYHLMY